MKPQDNHQPEYLASLLHTATNRRMEAGVTFVTQGETDKDVYILLAGRVEITLLSANGRKIRLDEFAAPSVFGHFAATTGQPRTASATTLTPCQFAIVRGDAFQNLLANSPECRQFVFENMGQCLIDVNEAVRRIGTLPPDARLAAYLLKHAHPDGTCPVRTQQDLADTLGLTRETISRLLSDWRDKGWVTTGRGHIKVTNMPALHDIS